jgi:NAD(P)-dependent dehydrogenase (short-subunit alcohol dehydrogenase family)
VDDRTTALRCDHRDDAQVEATANRIIAETGAIDIS